MEVSRSILAIIPARGGSKGIPKKNILTVAGKPLIAWTIEAAKRSRFLTRTIVSSDDEGILSVAREYGAETVVRPEAFAADHISTDETSLQLLDELKRTEQYIPDVVVLLQPTSPLRTTEDIDSSISLLIEKGAGAVISVTEGDRKHLKSFFVIDGCLSGIVKNEFAFMNRQDLPRIYLPNGALFVVTEPEFRKNGIMFSERTVPYVMEKERSVDIDTLEDIPVVEAVLSSRSGSSRRTG